MNKEDLIKKLEKLESPEIELQGHKSQLKMALLNSGYFNEERFKIKNLIMNYSKILVPAGIALALILVVGIGIFSPGEKNLVGTPVEKLAMPILESEVRTLEKDIGTFEYLLPISNDIERGELTYEDERIKEFQKIKEKLQRIELFVLQDERIKELIGGEEARLMFAAKEYHLILAVSERYYLIILKLEAIDFEIISLEIKSIEEVSKEKIEDIGPIKDLQEIQEKLQEKLFNLD